MTAVLNFLEGKGTDHRGRSLKSIQSESEQFWSEEHDFIQWLFPLDEKSMSVPTSPVIRQPEIQRIRDSDEAQASLDKNLLRYQQYLKKDREWHRAYDHNHLRITRVLKSLKLLQDLDRARGFKYWVALQLGDQIDVINEKTKQYWRLM